ncbi:MULTISPECIES: hypothetical protein [Corynebacterium]|uniref:hypothetical protein n=1 Tax=Corynebacterium TaxID=1716 RepID=UPI00124D9A0A|nr:MULTISPECIES: hypothetical protein [Corynebacterium]
MAHSRTLAAVLAALGIGFAWVQPAQAEVQVPSIDMAQPGGVNVDTLLDWANSQSEDVQQAIAAVMEEAEDTDLAALSSELPQAFTDTKAVQRGDSTEKSKFYYPAPVLGCGIDDLPVTGALATVQPGPNYGFGPLLGKGNLLDPYIPAGHAYFHVFTADTRLAPSVKGTDMKVAWLNLKTMKAGVNALDESVLGANVHAQTSALVNTGSGPVIAAIAGTTSYGEDSCTVLPTVGSTTVS